MKLFAQHGYGKKNRIETGFEEELIDGVVLSPRDEKPENLVDFINSINRDYPEKNILLDPQFYAANLLDPNDRYLPNYPYYHSGLRRINFISSTNIKNYVKETIDYQLSLPLTSIVSPTICIESFRDQWSQISINLAFESQEYANRLDSDKDLFASLLIAEEALSDTEGLMEMLDLLTQINVDGYYIIIKRYSNSYNLDIGDRKLANLMYLTYVLGELNHYKVIYGYFDFIGLILLATGASAIGCGWYNSLKQFSMSKFEYSTGGKRARPRYSTSKLFNTILLIPELSTIKESNLIDLVFIHSGYDNALLRETEPANWEADLSYLHHWKILSQFIEQLNSLDSFSNRLEFTRNAIQNSARTFDLLKSRNIPLETKDTHLEKWNESIDIFNRMIDPNE